MYKRRILKYQENGYLNLQKSTEECEEFDIYKNQQWENVLKIKLIDKYED